MLSGIEIFNFFVSDHLKPGKNLICLDDIVQNRAAKQIKGSLLLPDGPCYGFLKNC